jgi:two-component system sensor histidine kinase VicK
MNLNYDTNTKYNVNVDEGKIKQVFLNIIDNAIKYTPVGEVNIFINKTLNNKVLVKIEDTGVGIKPEVLPNLFNKFVRAPDASKVNILGTGLGLYVAGQILKAHNGRAWGESKGKGEGSKFYVELPGV